MKAARVLVVEDDITIGAMLGEILADMGHAVCATETTEAGAITAAARCRPDLMIVDVRLGSGCGMRATDAILRGGSVPHIFVTGDIFAMIEYRSDAVVIHKPFFTAQLAEAIEQVLAP